MNQHGHGHCHDQGKVIVVLDHAAGATDNVHRSSGQEPVKTIFDPIERETHRDHPDQDAQLLTGADYRRGEEGDEDDLAIFDEAP